MNDMNFDSLLNLTTPQSFIDKALSIEAKEQKPKVLFSAYFNRTLGAVACLVLICILSVTLFSLTHNNSTLTAQPQGPTTHVDNTESTDSKNEYSNDNRNDSSALIPDVFEQVEETKPTQSNDNKKPTQKPQNSTQAQNPTDAKEPTSSSPDVDPSEPVSQKPTDSDPYYPTESAPQEPETPVPSGPGDDDADVDPSEASTEPPIVTPTQNVYCQGMFSSSLLKDSDKVYCMLYNSNGTPMGNDYLYSNKRLATIIINDGDKATVAYNATAKGIALSSGRYTYKFYTSRGTVVYTGAVYV